MLRPHRHFKCCPLTFDCFLAGPKAGPEPAGILLADGNILLHKTEKQRTKNGKFNELAKVPSGMKCLRSQLLFRVRFFFSFRSGRNYFQQICQIKLHIQEAAAVASLEGPKFGCLRIELKSWCGLAVAAATPSKMPQINVHSFCLPLGCGLAFN